MSQVDTMNKKESSVIIAYHLEPGTRFWDEYYGHFLTVLSNEYEPRTNTSTIQTKELPYTISMDAMEFVPLREPPHNP